MPCGFHRAAENLAVCLIEQHFLGTNTIIIFPARLETVYAHLVFYVETRFLPRKQSACGLGFHGVSTIFHPSVHHGVSLIHYAHAATRNVLQIRVGTEKFVRPGGKTNVSVDRTMVGSLRFIDNAPAEKHHVIGFLVLEQGNIVYSLFRIIGGKSWLLGVGEQSEIF